MTLQEDPYLNLEEIEGSYSLEFANAANKMCLRALGDPTTSGTSEYSRILKSLESDERIPFVSKMGKDDKGKDVLYNLWKDNKVRDSLFRASRFSGSCLDDPMAQFCVFLCSNIFRFV